MEKAQAMCKIVHTNSWISTEVTNESGTFAHHDVELAIAVISLPSLNP